jgi:hypothetical protein
MKLDTQDELVDCGEHRHLLCTSSAWSFSSHALLQSSTPTTALTMEAQTLDLLDDSADLVTPSIVINTHQYPSTPSRKYTIPAYRIDLDTAKSPSTREQIYAGPRSTSPNFLTKFPLESVFRILDCMWPEEYAGLACTCRLALELTNDQAEKQGLNLSWQFSDEVYDDCFVRNISLAIACRMVRGWERQVEELEGCDTCGLHFSESEDNTGVEGDDNDDDILNNPSYAALDLE